MNEGPARIAQVNVTYQREEDRLLLKIRSTENEEFRLWLTRRFTQLLLRAIEKLLAGDPEPRQSAALERATREFEHDRITAAADRDTPYDESAESFPLGRDGVLGYGITVKPGNPPTLVLFPREGTGVSLPAQKQLLHNLHHLLQQSSGAAEWKLETALQPGQRPSDPKKLN